MVEGINITILLFQEKGLQETLLEKALTQEGIFLFRVSHPDVLVETIRNNHFDFILVCQGNFSYKALTFLKTNTLTKYTPLFYLYTDSKDGWNEIKNILSLCGIGPDDFLPITTLPDIISYKICTFLKRLEDERSTNPLTGLPGNKLIEKEIALRLKDKNSNWTLIYADLNNFKPYNDLYGFSKGDDVIHFLAEILKRIIRIPQNYDAFIGHIGGDDFIIILQQDDVDSVSNSIKKDFSSGLNNFYTEKDLARGCIISWNREGERNTFPLLGLSMVFLPLDGRFNTITELSRKAARAKKSSKRKTFVSVRTQIIQKVPSGIEPDDILKDSVSNEDLPLIWRRAALEALGEIGNEETSNFFAKFLAEDKKPRLRKSAAYALGRIKSSGLAGVLLPYLNDSDPHVRTRVVEALGTLGDSNALIGIQALKDDPNPYVRSAVMVSLGRMQDNTSLEILHTALQDKDINVRLNAIEALGELKSPESLPYFTRQLFSTEIKIKYAAVRSIGKLSIPEAEDVLIPLLKEKDVYLIWLSLRGIVSLLEAGWSQRDESLFQIFIKLLSHFNSYIRKESAIALGYWGNIKAVKYLIKQLKDKNEFVRWSTAEALCRLSAPSAIFALVASLNDKNEYVRSAACWALGESKSDRALEPLRKSLKDISSRVRESAAYSIAKILATLGNKDRKKIKS